MPVTTKHSDYDAWAPAWALMRDCMSGQRAIHKHAELRAYLPRLSGETNALYDARLARSPWYNATWRSVEAYVGMLFRKEPKVKVSTGAEVHLVDVTKTGQTFAMFARSTGQEFEGVGRCGVLVDYPRRPAGSMTVAQLEAQNIRPHMALYPAENIINWRYEWVNNRSTLALLVLAERHETVRPGDEFLRDSEPRYRVLDLLDGVYRQRVFMENGTLVEDSEIFPLMNNAPMREIPFEFFGDGVPPLEDLAHLNVSHFQTTSDLEHGAHKTALPQPWVAGITVKTGPNGLPAPGQELTIGGGDAWVLPTGATCGMLEYTGAGLSALEGRATAKETQMAIVAARMLEQQKSGVESAETAGIHRSGEQSTLQSHADQLAAGFARVLSWFDQWCGGPGGATCEVNKQFMPSGLSAQEMTALLGVWQAGGMSFEEFFTNLQQGGRISDATDVETEKGRIETAPPVLPAAPAIDDGGFEE